METFLAAILLWPVNFEPNGWLYCAGQLLNINQNAALFSLLGTTYGGNGTTNFALPDLRGRIPVGAGSGTGLTPYVLGQTGGAESVTLTANQLPSHAHTYTVSASDQQAMVSVPTASSSLAAPYDTVNASGIAGYNSTAPNTALNIGATVTGSIGGNLPTPLVQPYLGLNYIIALTGIFPSRG
jgi:microcystin-dependent protein